MHRLELANVSVRRNGRNIVDCASFTAASRAVVALLGPNGAGKTTLLSAIAQLVPSSGCIELDGTTSSQTIRRSTVLIPEIPTVFPLLTVWEHLEFVARSLRAAPSWRARAELLLERLHLRDARDTVGADLSKGMRQKTLIAASILAAMPVYLFDEPMVGLDVHAQRELRAIFRELAESAVVVVSTHQIEVAVRDCARAVILTHGAIRADVLLRDDEGSPTDAAAQLEELVLALAQ